MDYALTSHEFRTPRGRPASMLWRVGTSDYNTLFSALNEDEYGLAGYGLTGRAADVGAHIGSVTVGLLLDNPGLYVIAVEPVPPNVDLLRQNLERNGVADRCEIVEAAAGKGKATTIRYGAEGTAGDTPEEAENATHHAFIGNSALVYPKSPKRPHTSLKVPVIGVRDLLPVDLIKIDCEGGEWGFLASDDVKEVELILGEVHPVNGHTPMHLVPLLAQTHDVTFTGPPAGPCGFVAVRR